MGLVYVDLKVLMAAGSKNGVRAKFPRIATIGRQGLYLHPHEVRELSSLDEGVADVLKNYVWGDYSEPLLIALYGAEEVTSFDASDYEGATIVHDMNEPLDDFTERFDLVIDGGSLEHVFNFPTAISNMMRMSRIGGRILTSTPANNLMGHGFYQFSPELLFRVFSMENGFTVNLMLLTEHTYSSVEKTPPHHVVRVRDPKQVRARVSICGGRPLMVRALVSKTARFEGFSKAPQQSDYVAKWSEDSPGDSAAGSLRAWIKWLYRHSPQPLQNAIDERRLGYKLSNRNFFVPWDGRVDDA